MTIKEKIDKAKEKKIDIPDELADREENIVGVYKIFKVKGKERVCLYIGKSTDVGYRLLGSSGGHIYMYLNDDFSKLVPILIDNSIKAGYNIEVEIKRVDYHDTTFSRAAHRLALAEISEIVKYQEMGQCIYQTPEGVGENEEKFWEEHYKI